MTNISVEPVFAGIIQRHVEETTWHWLREKALLCKGNPKEHELAVVFSAISSKTGKAIISVREEEKKAISTALPGFSVEHWNLARLCRVWMLMQVDSSSKHTYVKAIESLFANAEMNELVALYSSLPVLDYPGEWTSRCSEGVRSNIGDVLEAIMYNNPYAANYLDDAAWNQMVLKAFFTQKEIGRIVGIERRSNLNLAVTLADYASERASAGRPINPDLWPLLEKFSLNKPQ